MILTKEELMTINGGGSSKWAVLGAAAAGVLTFLFGMLDGIFRPLACNK